MMPGLSIALTGGIACGKSAVAFILAKTGVPVLDTDAVAHDLLKPGHAVYDAVVEAFGQDYVGSGGVIDRQALARLIFKDAQARERLNGLMHPAIYEQVFAWIAQHQQPNLALVVVIPLLFETGQAKRFDRILVVAADEETAIQRMLTRGWTRAQALARMQAQWPLAEKISRADAVIWNNHDLKTLEQETLRIWRVLAGSGRQTTETALIG